MLGTCALAIGIALSAAEAGHGSALGDNNAPVIRVALAPMPRSRTIPDPILPKPRIAPATLAEPDERLPANPRLAAVPALKVDAIAAPRPQPIVPAAIPARVATLPAPEIALAPIAAPVERAPASPAYIDQLSRPRAESREVAAAQALLAEAAPVTLADAVAAMQVPAPPAFAMGDDERAKLMTEAPMRLQVRVGDNSRGMVALRMGTDRQVEVQLAGLIDVLAGDLGAADAEALGSAAAAQEFVGLERLRAVGIAVEYDPVYDEIVFGG